LERNAVFAFAFELRRQQIANRRGQRAVLAPREAQMLPLGVFDEDRGVDGASKVRGQGGRAASGRGDARQGLGEGEQCVNAVAADATGLDRVGVVHV
jgi:hypothetical protein